MNTFAAILLAWPFYLAIKGKLSTYVAFAKPGSAANTTTSSTAATTAAVPSLNTSTAISAYNNLAPNAQVANDVAGATS